MQLLSSDGKPQNIETSSLSSQVLYNLINELSLTAECTPHSLHPRHMVERDSLSSSLTKQIRGPIRTRFPGGWHVFRNHLSPCSFGKNGAKAFCRPICLKASIARNKSSRRFVFRFSVLESGCVCVHVACIDDQCSASAPKEQMLCRLASVSITRCRCNPQTRKLELLWHTGHASWAISRAS